MRRPVRQRGAALLLAVMLVIAIAAVGAIVAGSMSSSDVTDSRYQGAAVEALYAAETGVERAMREYASGVTACNALAGTQTVAANRTFTLLNGLTTDFSGVALPNPNTQCRIRVTGAVTNTTERLLHAIVDSSLLSGLNPTFNAPLGTGSASSWTVTTGGQDYTGGPDPSTSAPTSCSRAIYAVKARDGSGGNFGSTLATATLPNIQIAGGQTITVRFNYRAVELANGSAACNIQDAGSTNPGNATHVQIRFSVTDNAGLPLTSFSNVLAFNIAAGNSLRAAGAAVTGAAAPCTPTTQQVTAWYAGCASLYQAGTPASKGNLTITVLGAGTRTLVAARVYIYLRAAGGAAGNAREAWVDNVEFINTTVTGVARTSEWRDCAVSTCPNI